MRDLARVRTSPAHGHELAIETTGQLTLHVIREHHADARATFNRSALETLETPESKTGTPVLFTATVVESELEADDPAARRWLVRVEGSDTLVLVTRAQVMWQSESGVVFVGGILAGQYEPASPEDENDEPALVVERGFIVSATE